MLETERRLFTPPAYKGFLTLRLFPTDDASDCLASSRGMAHCFRSQRPITFRLSYYLFLRPSLYDISDIPLWGDALFSMALSYRVRDIPDRD